MQTCLSDDRPLASLVFGGVWIALGTVWLSLWLAGAGLPAPWPDLRPLFALANYGLGAYYLRYGVSGETVLGRKLRELLEPRWLD